MDPERLHVLLAAHREAHECRRRWENHIWQYGVFVAALAAFYVGYAEKVSVIVHPTLTSNLILTLVAAFVLSISLNVWRARVLANLVMHTIEAIDKEMNNNYPVIPIVYKQLAKEEDGRNWLKRFWRWFMHVPSTIMAVVCHFAAAAFFIGYMVYMWSKYFWP